MSEAEVFHCVICTKPIPESRVIRKAVTCSEAHAKELKNARRRRRDEKVCHTCRRPTSPAQWAEFRAWQESKGNKIQRGWKKGVKRKAEEAKPADPPAPSPIEDHLGSITV